MNTMPAKSDSATASTRDQVIALMELLETRMQWSTAKTIIAGTGIHASRGWLETLGQLREDFYGEGIWACAYETLSSVVLQHTYVGNKHVSFFDLREQHEAPGEKFLTWVRKQAKNDLRPILDRKPFNILNAPTQTEDLKTYKSVAPQLIAAKFQANKLYLQFFSTRSYLKREPLDIMKMGAAPMEFFKEYDGIFGVRSRMVPCFDTIVVDTTNDLVEFRADFQPGMTEDKDVPPFTQVMDQFNRLTTKFIGQQAVDVGLMNLHPAINPIYLDMNCGKVTALGFVATGQDSSSNNHGQIHRSKTQDFRKDSFHVGGKSHVDKVDPYTIGITWPGKPPKGDLYLELKGSVRAIYAGKLRAVTTAEILGCLNESDYDFVVNQILSRLKRRKK